LDSAQSSSIRKNSAIKGPIHELVRELRSGKDPRSIEPVRVFSLDGKLFTLDRRRVYAAELAGVDVHYKLATIEEVQRDLWKLSRVPGEPVMARPRANWRSRTSMMHEDDVKSISRLADSVTELVHDVRDAKHGGNITLETFLEAMSRWLHDVAGTKSLPESVQNNPEVCSAFALILRAARHYD
jgi:hypothetical protein